MMCLAAPSLPLQSFGLRTCMIRIVYLSHDLWLHWCMTDCLMVLLHRFTIARCKECRRRKVNPYARYETGADFFFPLRLIIACSLSLLVTTVMAVLGAYFLRLVEKQVGTTVSLHSTAMLRYPSPCTPLPHGS